MLKLSNKAFLAIIIAVLTLGVSSIDVQAKSDKSKSATKVYNIVSVGKADAKKAPEFSWDDNGKNIKFSEFTKNKYVLLNFWGTWCPPCRRELPDLVAISKEMKKQNLLVIGIALENSRSQAEAFKTVKNFWEAKELYYPVIVGNLDIANAYGGIQAVPTTFLINKKGEIVSTIQGGRSKEEFMQEINKMMKK